MRASSTDRQPAKQRVFAQAAIKSLLLKTVLNGCTEAEADAAAAKVHELLLKYPPDQPAGFVDRVLSPAEVMELTGLGRSTVERARRDGELRFIQLTPRRVGLRMSELQAWLASRGPAALKAPEAA
jgi:excisionase family DNA binding protein